MNETNTDENRNNLSTLDDDIWQQVSQFSRQFVKFHEVSSNMAKTDQTVEVCIS